MDLTSLGNKTDHLQQTVDNIEADLIGDRTKIDVIINKLDTLQSTLNTFSDRLPRTESKITDAVAKGVEEGTDELKKDIKKLTDQKIVVVTKASSLWQKLFKKGR